MTRRNSWAVNLGAVVLIVAACVLLGDVVETAKTRFQPSDESPNQVLDWNQIFVDTLIATNTANSSSQRLGAIVHTAIFDAYNGIERRDEPMFVQATAPRGASRRAAVIAAAYTALVGLFPSRQTALDESYAESIAALSDDGGDGGQSRERGIAWGIEVAQAVLAWRANDGFNLSRPAFNGGDAVGQWRRTPPAFGPMSAQGLAFTATFALVSNTQFGPLSPRSLTTQTYTDDFNAVKCSRPQNRIDPHRRSDDARAVLGGQRQRPLESGRESDCARQPSVVVCQQPVAGRLERRDGRYRIHYVA